MTDLRTRPDLDAIKARAEAATPGPWQANTDHHQRGLVTHSVWVDAAGTYAAEQCPDAVTAAFIAAARTDVPALLAEVERLTAVVESVTQLAKEWADPLNSHAAALALASVVDG